MLMDHPLPMTEKNYRTISNIFNQKIKVVAEKLMHEACEEIRGLSLDSEFVDTGVTVDGTWQKRGFTSMNGAVAAISIDTGHVVDIDMLRYCQGCINLKAIENADSEQYNKRRKEHKCSINHEGSAPKMEQSGVERIFARSITKNKLHYTEYYGDGDTKSFSAVNDFYEGVTVLKKECIGHVQKRVGSRLRKLKKKLNALEPKV